MVSARAPPHRGIGNHLDADGARPSDASHRDTADQSAQPRPDMHAASRAICAVTIALAFLLPSTASVAAAGLARPSLSHHPRFVTEREAGRWEDCVWASAAMLVDKWTAGRMIVSKDRLRKLSGDRKGGSSLEMVGRVLRKIGLPARTSPLGGASITWTDLRARLAAGGGAILLGDDSKLPRWFGRWDLTFWGRTGNRDDHAVYLDRYDPAHDRFWVMDPLAPAGWRGEWIGGRDLRAFAWSTPDGAVSALMTPAALLPFAGVRLGPPTASAGSDALHVSWPVAKAPRHWSMPKVDVVLTASPAPDGLLLPGPNVLTTPPVPSSAGGGGRKPVASSVRFGGGVIRASLPIPTVAGTYLIEADLRERRLHRVVAATALTVYVPGDRRATIATVPSSGPEAVGRFAFTATVTNTGTATWSDPEWAGVQPPEAFRARATRLVATWVEVSPADVTSDPDSTLTPGPVTLAPLPLTPGQNTSIAASIATPTAPGHWALMLDIVDDVDGSFAANGSRPGAILVDLVEAVQGVSPVAAL